MELAAVGSRTETPSDLAGGMFIYKRKAPTPIQGVSVGAYAPCGEGVGARKIWLGV